MEKIGLFSFYDYDKDLFVSICFESLEGVH
jgi:hypothetical protein